MKITNCQHKDKKHYAQGFCKGCYDLYRKSVPVTCSVCLKERFKSMCQYDVITRKYTCNSCNKFT